MVSADNGVCVVDCNGSDVGKGFDFDCWVGSKIALVGVHFREWVAFWVFLVLTCDGFDLLVGHF